MDAQVLTFDEVRPDPLASPILGTVTCSAGTGFRFSSDHFHAIGPDFGPLFSTAGTTHLGYESGRGFPITMVREGTGTFSLLSLDAGEFYAAPDPERPDAEWITLTGTRADGTVVTHNITLDGIRDGAGGAPDYQHFVLPNTFVNLRSVVFTGWRTGNESGGLAIDNLQYQFDSPDTLPACTFAVLPSDLPTVSFVSPAAGVVSGTVTVEANATDNIAVGSVTFKLNGVQLAPPDTQAPYTLQWNTTTLPDGPYTLTAEALDTTNNLGTASISITIQNGVVISDGPHYLDLDGLDDYLLAGDAPALSFGTGTADRPFTMEMWLRPDAVQGRSQILGKAGEYRLKIIYGTLMLELVDESSQALVTVFTNGVDIGALVGSWHHIAVTYDGRGGADAASGVTMYIDGTAVPVWRSTGTGYVAMEDLASPVVVGHEADSWNQYDGGLDELRLWSVARTPTQILGAMGIEIAGSTPGLVGYWQFNEGIGWSASDETANGFNLALFNGTQWAADGPLAPDTTAPLISNIVVANLTPTTATITFTTNETATGWVSYVAGTACPCNDVYSATLGTTHSVTLTGLTPDTQYQFQAKASDPSNNLRVAAAQTFHTLAPSNDTQAPTVAFTAPAAGAVSGSVFVQATASDNVGVVSVQFKLDGVNLGAADAQAPYTVTWDTTTLVDGPHTLTAEARDAADNIGTATVAVTVQNGVVTEGPHYIELDGVNDSARVADVPALSFGNGTADTAFTMEMWLRPDAVQSRHQLIGKSGEYRVALIYGSVLVELRDESSHAVASISTSNVDLAAMVGGWHHLAVTYDGRGGAGAANGVTIYVDGVPAGLWRSTDAGYVAMENLTAPLEIGHESDSWNQYDGGLDELRLWNVLRNNSQIIAGMAGELAGTETGLVAYWRFNEGFGTAVVDDSPNNATAVLMNGTAWALDGPLAPDTTAPVIGNIAVSNITPTTATITFTTNELTTGWVSYVAGTACPCTDAFSAGVALSHSITLTGLAPDTNYRFQAKATDSAANQQVAGATTFRTLVLPVDGQAPTVSITNPTAGPVFGTITLDATASDNVGVVSVQFKLDGVLLATDNSSPYSASWDTTTVADGAHTLTAEARDASNNVGTASVAVSVQNNPASATPHYVDFDGVDDAAHVADAPALSFGNGTSDTPFTMEMWIHPDAVQSRHQLLGKSGEYRVAIIYGTLVVDLRDASSNALASVSSNGLNLAGMIGAWHHLAVTYDGRGGSGAANGISAYVDGVPVGLWRSTDGGYVAMENLTAPLEIARESQGWNQFDGAIDDLRMWNVARTPAEIQSSMGVELAGTNPGLVAYWRFNIGVGASVPDDSPNSHVATLVGGAAWQAGGPLVPDTTAPAITNIATANLTPTGVTISFTTSEAATGWVSYAAGAACPCTDAFSAAIGTAHSITLSGLAPNTSYRYEVKAHDAADNQQASTVLTFQTPAVPTDGVAPTVSLTSPSGTVAGIVAVTATASDNVGVVSVEFKLDGVSLGIDNNAPYSLTWDTTAAADGAHTLSAEARDAANNLATSSVAVLVQNSPANMTPHYIALDGVDDYARVADAPALSFGNGTSDAPFTIEVALRPDAVQARHQVLGKAGEYRVAIIYNTLVVELRDESANAMAAAYSNGLDLTSLIGSWHRLAITYDGRGGAAAANGITVYLDGVAVPLWRGTDASYVAMENRTAPLEIGHESDGWNQYAGGLDELRIWNIARTQSAIQASMGAELAGTESGLAAYWRFNAGTGTTVVDDSPASHTATLPIATLWVAGGPF